MSAQIAESLGKQESRRLRSPWVSGTFYLVAALLIVALLLVAGQILSLWAIPLVIIGGVLIVSIVGALQLRQDDRLSERGFLKLMGDTLKRLPLVLAKQKGSTSDQTPPTSGSDTESS